MLDYTHLEALLAVEKEGSFEAAAKVLNLSPIGVATRIRKLEDRMGVTLLTRKPTRPTEAGGVLVSYAQQVRDLEDELVASQKAHALQPPDEDRKLRIAINDESQLPWISNIFDMQFGDSSQPWLLDVDFIDQDHTIQHLKNGDLIAATSSNRQPAHGFKSHVLGSVDYVAVASPQFIEERFEEVVDLTSLLDTPCIRRSDDDELCFQWLQQCFGETVALTCYRMPNLENLIELCLKGNGWSVLPRSAIEDHYKSGALCELVPDTTITKELYWHVAGIMADELAPITKSVKNRFSSYG